LCIDTPEQFWPRWPPSSRVGHGIWFNDHIDGDGPTLFRMPASKAGDAAFLANFASNLALIDFITNPLSSGGTLDQLTATTDSATASISSGEVMSAVPIPATLPLLVGGLAGLWALARKRKDRRQQPSLPAIA
jgi:hypothetical protein